MEERLKKIGTLIHERRMEKEMSIEDVSRKTTITWRSVWSIEHGRPMNLQSLMQVCDVLGLEIVIKRKGGK